MLSSPRPDISESQLLSDISDSLPFSFGNFSFISDLGISITTTLVEEVIQAFPITQASFDSISIMNAISRLEDDKSDTYKLTHLDPKTVARATRQERMKKLMERRFTHPQKMTPHYFLEGR